MRREKLPDGDNDKVTLKRSRDLLILFRMSIFGAAHDWGRGGGGGKRPPPP